ncbi:TIGR03915 family putative DNA repair protein [Herbivorax sp. ANBcel31]|uniref:TIGR03915 family putative DNA repair protein n=1 Tax=Herbivorax sp. ANBcel31 TaxID=3069754 RepID=UPI0027B45AE1|nr:TIGR03915 family putative DNA repair protein [Herbivorax sp. ANBcel31]MDQ2087485.1 TIGR03915 family putative DNA repair protein [Herbivorax sp. ANBcel31]
MINYYYDGSFEGLLTAIYEAYYRRESPLISPEQKNMQIQMFVTNIKIETSDTKASKVYEAIHKKISYNALKNVYHAYLSEVEGISQNIFKYLKFGFKAGKKIDFHLTDERVLPVHKAAKSVQRERHLMLGILRFKSLHDDLYYASYEPDHNITALLISHFSKRLSSQNWIIHDVKRNIAAVYDKVSCVITDLPREIYNQPIAKTDDYESLFKEFFNSICIKERINPKLQKQFLPKRYWKHLIEK